MNSSSKLTRSACAFVGLEFGRHLAREVLPRHGVHEHDLRRRRPAGDLGPDCHVPCQHCSEVQSGVIPVIERTGTLDRCKNDSERRNVMESLGAYLNQCHETRTKCVAGPCRFMIPRLAERGEGQIRSPAKTGAYTHQVVDFSLMILLLRHRPSSSNWS